MRRQSRTGPGCMWFQLYLNAPRASESKGRKFIQRQSWTWLHLLRLKQIDGKVFDGKVDLDLYRSWLHLLLQGSRDGKVVEFVSFAPFAFEAVFSRACIRWQSCFDVVVLDLGWTWWHQVPPKLRDGNLVNGKVEPDHVFCLWRKLMERRSTPKSNGIRSTLIAPFASGFRRWKFRCVDWFWLTLGALSFRKSGHGRVFLFKTETDCTFCCRS